MAQLRWRAPGVRFYEMVQKCAGDEMLMRPDAGTVYVIGEALALACVAFPRVRVLAFSFVSNHFHLILWVETDEDALDLSDFMKALDQQIAQDLNRLRGREGHFFRGRPRETPILEVAYLLERITYTHTQPVHHGLVERVEEWPGLSSFRAVCEGRASVEVSCLREDEWREAGADPRAIGEFTDSVSVPLSTPPMWAELSETARRAERSAHEASVRAREREESVGRRARGEHRRLPKGEHYRRIDPFSRPDGPPARREKPWAHADAASVQAYREAFSVMLAAYRVASARFRATGVLCAFPVGTLPPWIARAPVMT